MKNLITVLLIWIVAACATQTDDNKEQNQEPEKLVSEEVTYSTDSTSMNGYLVYKGDPSIKRPGVLVVHEWWGHNDYTRKRAEMLADLGYTALAIDMYGDGKKAEHPTDAGKFMREVFSNMDEAKLRFEKALYTIKNHKTVDGDNVSAIGYCFGGSVILSMANAGSDLDLVAAFHSGVNLPIKPDSSLLKAKVLVFNGGADPFIPAESVASFKQSMEVINADFTYVNYDSVVHGFTNPGANELGEKFNMPLAYDKMADSLSWEALKSELALIYD